MNITLNRATANAPSNSPHFSHPTKNHSISSSIDSSSNLIDLLKIYTRTDVQLTNGIAHLQRISPTDLADQTELIHLYQEQLLSSLDEIRGFFTPILNAPLAPKIYRESVFFSAQALASGFHIRGLEAHTPELRGIAEILCSNMESVRVLLREIVTNSFSMNYIETLSLNQIVKYDPIQKVLLAQKQFDLSYETFRKEITHRYLQHRELTNNQATEQSQAQSQAELQLQSQLQSQNDYSSSLSSSPSPLSQSPSPASSTTRLLQLFIDTISEFTPNFIDMDALASCDPTVMIALPRLSVLKALRDAMDIPIAWGWQESLKEDDDDEMDLEHSLQHLSITVQSLSLSQFHSLGARLSTTNLNESVTNPLINELFLIICQIADGMGRGKRARYVCKTIGKAVIHYEVQKEL